MAGAERVRRLRHLSRRRHRLRRRRGGGDPAGSARLRRRGGRRARAHGKLYRRRGRARGEASRPLSHERRHQGALRGLEEEVIRWMFFPLSKILGFFAISSNLVVEIGILGLLLLPTYFAPAGRALADASLVVPAILGLSPAGNALIIPLEERFPRWDATRGAPDGIIVLGGAISPDV